MHWTSLLLSQCIEQVLYYHNVLNKSFIITMYWTSPLLTLHKSYYHSTQVFYYHSAKVLYYHSALNNSFIITVHWTSPLLSQYIEQVLYYHSTKILLSQYINLIITVHKSYFHNTLNKSFIITVHKSIITMHWTSLLLS